MMDVYITYDRYEHNEWFYVYHIDTDYDNAYRHCVEEDLPGFISYGPDDCHSFQLVKISVSRSTYYKLRKWVNTEKVSDEEQKKFDRFMEKVYANYFDCEGILHTDGQSDFFAIIEYHCGEEPEYDDYDDEEEYETDLAKYEEKVDELRSNDELFAEVLKNYIASNY